VRLLRPLTSPGNRSAGKQRGYFLARRPVACFRGAEEVCKIWFTRKRGGVRRAGARQVQRTKLKGAEVRKDCGSPATGTRQVAVLVTRQAALHCLRVTAPEGEG
jgi:hypothetical protein